MTFWGSVSFRCFRKFFNEAKAPFNLLIKVCHLSSNSFDI